MALRRKSSIGHGKPCHYCKRTMIESKPEMTPDERSQSATIDHMHSKDLGGTNDSYNLIVSCARCNVLKGNIPYSVFVVFARSVLRQFPNATTTVLRRCLNIYIVLLAEHAMKRNKDVNEAIRMSLLKMSDELDNQSYPPIDGKSRSAVKQGKLP